MINTMGDVQKKGRDLSAYSGHLHVVTVGNGIFPAKLLDRKCYADMADRKKC